MDTNKMRDISREQFEAVFSEKYPLTFAAAKAGESEAHGAVSIAWWGWQASREAVVVELPPKWSDEANSNKQAWDCGIEDARMAIEAQGLKVEVKP
ncbi:hypothetical protein [Pseudomonas putida]|uniref:Uncharacterized protein n=1 Tax=Pseudomonas putida TaxID=303 RepID=A0A7V8EKL7_PSEPU|nr:hypothetical protein [Pseudomonas putida]KAF0255907.1 hypothetical protein GN299_05375 [Pseudomonas putida]